MLFEDMVQDLEKQALKDPVLEGTVLPDDDEDLEEMEPVVDPEDFQEALSLLEVTMESLDAILEDEKVRIPGRLRGKLRAHRFDVWAFLDEYIVIPDKEDEK